MGPGGLKVTFPAEDNPATHMKRMGELFTDFKNNFETGDAGKRFFGPLIEPWTAVLTGIEANTAATAAKLPDKTTVETAPAALNFFQSTLSQAVGTLVGITGEERGLRAQEAAADLLLQLVEKEPSEIVVPGAGIITPAFD